ncbi:MAG: HDOD domain-containing protein [Methylococcaceae bacterium]|nr:HDOD domain-containing protein [Methylococcaceae bacterium]
MLWKFFKKLTHETSPAPLGKSTIHTQIPLAYLQKLIPIGELPIEKLRALPVTLRSFNPGDIVFTRGDQADSLPFLQEGEVFLETGSGGGYSVDASTFKACYPLSTDSEHKFSAFAKTPAKVVYLPLDILHHSGTLVNNPLINPNDIPAELRGSALFNGICAAYRKDELRVPSLPDVALRLRAALQKEISIGEAVKIVNLDPVISSKLIQVVNSPLYRSLNPAASCHDAINRLGLKTTQNLVTSISLNNLFRSTDKQLHEKIQHVWKQSIQIASLSHTLAAISHRLDAEEALLAGLTHNIGALPVITFAESFDKHAYSAEELELTIVALQGLLGVSILKKWHFPVELQQIPMQISNWYYDGDPALQLSDIVLLAKFHSQLGTARMQTLPPLNTLPAFHKLGDTDLTPDMSLQALHDAKQQIAEALNFFRA